MSDQDPDSSKDAVMRRRALARREAEGGGLPEAPQAAAEPPFDPVQPPRMGEPELAALHVRVIALENLLISLLATASESQLDLARDMAAYIAPRPGFTRHPATTRAAEHMTDLIERAARFRTDDG